MQSWLSPFQIARTQSKSGWCIPLWRVLEELTHALYDVEREQLFIQLFALFKPFTFLQRNHLLTLNGTQALKQVISILLSVG